tara:strand:+ start:1277 stop:1837 length:561 start_codon:yes stop_codon:yes gene_type:complete
MSKAAELAKFIGNNEQNMKLLLNATISSVAQYDIDSNYINSTYDTYKVIGRIVLATDNENLFLRFFSSDSILDGSVYAREAESTGSSTHDGSNSTSILAVPNGFNIGNVSGEGTAFEFLIQNVNSTVQPACVNGQSANFSNSANHFGAVFSGSLLASSASTIVNGLRFYASSGNLSTGNIKLYGIN